MVLIVKRIILFAVLVMVLSISCEEYFGPPVDCDDCWDVKPDSADLILEFTINDDHPQVPFVLYRENFEGRLIDWVDTALESTVYVFSAVDQYYSVAAEYTVGDKKIMVVDGDKLKVKHVSDECGWECWIVKDGIFKLELKFDN